MGEQVVATIATMSMNESNKLQDEQEEEEEEEEEEHGQLICLNGTQRRKERDAERQEEKEGEGQSPALPFSFSKSFGVNMLTSRSRREAAAAWRHHLPGFSDVIIAAGTATPSSGTAAIFCSSPPSQSAFRGIFPFYRPIDRFSAV